MFCLNKAIVEQYMNKQESLKREKKQQHFMAHVSAISLTCLWITRLQNGDRDRLVL